MNMSQRQGMSKNIMSSRRARVIEKMFPYWCPNCPKRYMFKKKFYKHFIGCDYRRKMMIEEYQDKVKSKLNRETRRKLGL